MLPRIAQLDTAETILPGVPRRGVASCWVTFSRAWARWRGPDKAEERHARRGRLPGGLTATRFDPSVQLRRADVMNTTTIPDWVDKIQADITATEWEWRQLDEQEWH